VDSLRLLRLPVARAPDLDVVLADLVAAIDLVALGVATRVVIGGLNGVEAVASEALGHAQASGVEFALGRNDDGGVRAIVGPRSG
jgi:hypothetical protein